jgi:hypothetical protein
VPIPATPTILSNTNKIQQPPKIPTNPEIKYISINIKGLDLYGT